MTAKNIRSESIENDVYITPLWCVRQGIREVLKGMHYERILDPGAGTGRFTQELRKAYPDSRIVAIDNHPDMGPWPDATVSIRDRDFLTFRPKQRFDLVMGNPPFTYAEEFARHALSISTNVVFLLRQGFLSSKERVPFWKEFPPFAVKIIVHRPKFIEGKGGDSSDYCWVSWGPMRDHLSYAMLDWASPLSKEERRE